MTNSVNLNALLAADIPDPTDFPPSSAAPGLRQLDSALRCDICSEFFEAPVSLPCGHCFCSRCIRSYMSDKAECPNCRKAANEGHLRVNPTLEQTVSMWKMARAYVLRLSKEEERRVAERQVDPQEIRPPFKKRKRDVLPDHDSDMDSTPGPSRKGKTSPVKVAKGKTNITEYDSDDLYIIPTSDGNEDELPSQPNEDDMVNCPLCDRKVRHKRINAHLDRGCASDSSDHEQPLDRRSQKDKWSKLLGGSVKAKRNGKERLSESDDTGPLPKATYATLKDKQLKDMLNEHKLPVTGDRHAWIERHKKWVILFNSNLDQSEKQRKTLQELRGELRKWEAQKAKKPLVDDPAAYQKTHSSEFAKLIEIARPKKASVVDQIVDEASNVSPFFQHRGTIHKSPVTVHRTSKVRHDEVIAMDSEEEDLDEA